jgi:polyphosphate kinase 2
MPGLWMRTGAGKNDETLFHFPGRDHMATTDMPRTHGDGNVKFKQKTNGTRLREESLLKREEVRLAGHKDNGTRKLKQKEYDKKLRRLQEELCTLQDWVKHKGVRVVILFEGRDGAGKGGTIRAITERVSPRVFRVVALPAPSDRERTQMYMQRYMMHFPAAGEIVIFDRSWYNRAGVEYVMGFCTPKQCRRFLEICPQVERYMVESGIILLKYWLEVSNKEQERRFMARIHDPLRQWKLSPMDLPSREKWYEYSRARDRMLEATDTPNAPWFIVPSDDKKRARLNCISHLLKQIPYKSVPREKIRLPDRSKKGAYDDAATLKGRHFVPEKY